MTEPIGQRTITPSGIEVFYAEEPRRYYLVDDVEVPSVTTILGCLEKPALVWWSQGVGVAGVLELLQRRKLVGDTTERELYLVDEDGPSDAATAEAIVELLKTEKISCNHIRDTAGKRGVSVHDAFEKWTETGEPPDPEAFPENEQGYVRGLCAFLEDSTPTPYIAEAIVGSPTHGYAGRYDLLAEIPECELNATPAGRKKLRLPQGMYLLDLKTSSGIYQSFFIQLAAYEAASVECGYPASDGQLVVRVTGDGKYEVRRSEAVLDDFLAVKGAYDALNRQKVAA